MRDALRLCQIDLESIGVRSHSSLNLQPLSLVSLLSPAGAVASPRTEMPGLAQVAEEVVVPGNLAVDVAQEEVATKVVAPTVDAEVTPGDGDGDEGPWQLVDRSKKSSRGPAQAAAKVVTRKKAAAKVVRKKVL